MIYKKIKLDNVKLDKYGRLLVDIYHNKSDVNLKINSINDL